ncbi:unnamed protein product [Schistosoma turkestanicum]|nr:unnamed protein product [Schistosoma turkestanicum]
MLRDCVLFFITTCGIFAYPNTKNTYDIMLTAKTESDDEYWCNSKNVENETLYITGFKPEYEPELVHHMILFACEEPGSSERLWKCGMTSDNEMSVCQGTESIIYSWAMGAPSFEMPKDVSFKVGRGTPNKYLVLQVHYKNAMNEEITDDDGSGFKMTTQSTPTEKLAGVIVLVSNEDIGPSQVASLNMAFSYTGNATLHPFAYRVHTHKHGVLCEGYVIDGDKRYLIGSKSPQVHQTFYPVENKSLEIHNENILAAKCVFENKESRIIRIGNTQNDEMCNFYIMYWVTKDNEQQLYDKNNQIYVGDSSEFDRLFQELRGKLFDDPFFSDFEFPNHSLDDIFDDDFTDDRIVDRLIE